MAFIWLCSYPKSGNTWLRILLTLYLSGKHSKRFSFANLIGPSTHLGCHLFDEIMGINSSDLTPGELDHYRCLFHEQFIHRFNSTTFTKTHESYLSPFTDKPMFPQHTRCKVIYLIRNPLDIATSYANHISCSIDTIIDHMNNSQALVRHGDASFDEHLNSWSSHVNEWSKQKDIPLLLVRYEDLLLDPHLALSRILQFSGFSIDPGIMQHAIDHSTFDKLQSLEQMFGFNEHSSSTSNFFRRGRSGEGKNELTKYQTQKILSLHDKTMRRFGYS